jgi:hypothetical protein
MGITYRCDFCDRQCGIDHGTVTVSWKGTERTYLICDARDGGDVGCLSFVNRALTDAGTTAREAHAEREAAILVRLGSRS